MPSPVRPAPQSIMNVPPAQKVSPMIAQKPTEPIIQQPVVGRPFQEKPTVPNHPQPVVPNYNQKNQDLDVRFHIFEVITSSTPPNRISQQQIDMAQTVKDQNLFHQVDTIGNIFTSGTATSENITDGVHEMK